MRFRRSRCASLLVVIVALYLVILSILRNSADQNSSLLLKKLELLNFDFARMGFLFKPKDSYSFNKWTDKLLDNLVAVSNPDEIKMSKFVVEPAHKWVTDTVNLPKYLKGEGENPHLAPFDPRFTLGIFLTHINQKLQQSDGNLEKLAIDHFHWGDWTDLSEIYMHALSSGQDRYRCPQLATTEIGKTLSNDIKDSATYCINDEEIAERAKDPSNSELFKLHLEHILRDPLRPGFHVYNHPGRSSSKNMALSGASFLNDFMPPPLSVLFLIPTESQKFMSINVPVNQDVLGRVRLVDTPIASGVAQVQDSVLIGAEVKKMVELLKNEVQTAFSPTRDLSAEDFYDPLERVFKELSNHYDMTPHEKNYFKSLSASISTERVPKYFNEARLVKTTRNWSLGGHYDWRFFKKLVNSSDKQLPILHGLLLAWLRFTSANNLTTWVAHGSLLSWYWNGMVFPWDADIDVQMPVVDLHRLAKNFNQTVVVDFGPDVQNEVRYGRYFLDCGTWISHRQTENGLNFIDARFIDLDLGLYIDVTGLAISNTMAPPRYDKLLPKELERPKYYNNPPGITKHPKFVPQNSPDEKEVERNTLLHLFNCRNNHFVSLPEITPLKLTYMEGVPAYIPHNFVDILRNEYGNQSMSSQKFRTYAFAPRLRLWQNLRVIREYIKSIKERPEFDMGNDNGEAAEIQEKLLLFTFTDKDYLSLLSKESSLLTEYVVTRDLTSLHQQEMNLLLDGQSTKDLLFAQDGHLKHEFKALRHDLTNFQHFKDEYDFDKEVASLATRIAELKPAS